MDKKIIIGQRLKELRLKNNLEQIEVAQKLGYKSDTTISKWENGKNLPTGKKLILLAQLFNTTTDEILLGEATPTETLSDLVTAISDKIVQLTAKGQESVLHFTNELLEREEADRIIQEEPIFKVYFRSAAKAGPKGYGYDDYDADYAYTDQKPPRHDVATKVDGDSMNPDYQDGDILYLRDYGASHYNGEECVIVIDDKSYFKRLYTTEDGLKLVSTNPDKDTYPDLYIDFPPTDGSHIKIFDVVGSFTPVEK